MLIGDESDLRADNTVGETPDRIFAQASSGSEQGQCFERLVAAVVAETPQFSMSRGSGRGERGRLGKSGQSLMAAITPSISPETIRSVLHSEIRDFYSLGAASAKNVQGRLEV